MTDSAKKEPKKSIIGKIKEAADDKEEQLAILSTFVRPVSYTHLTLPTNREV